ncbi:MAG: type II secretion system protein [Hormoscilla sp. SP5CHS1]|nr:type II secretion system protein [Hormoscilla sp. SP12CHS1]MBC6455872.1 type II secretion system protein [Hormoscilla sp. SP5CHS1]
MGRRKHDKQGRKTPLVGKLHPWWSRSNQSGFTIMESLMAIVVVAILVTSIAPMIVLAVATRVQARRVELATQAAWTYIDGLTAQTTPHPNHTVVIDTETTSWSEFIGTFAVTIPPANPSMDLGVGGCTSLVTLYPYCQNSRTWSLYCVDQDEESGCSTNSIKDMVIQAFRSTTNTGYATLADDAARQADGRRGYLVSVRVYQADAFSDDDELKSVGSHPTEVTGRQLTYTSGLGLRKVPLIEVTTEIPAEDGAGYSNLCERIGGCS